MSQNWMRHFEIQLLDEKGDGISLSEFKVVFKIEWFNVQNPRVGEFKVYNLAPDTVQRIMRQEFSKVQVIGGYQENHGMIFSGDIRFAHTGTNLVDNYVVIQVLDGLEAYISAKVSMAIKKGYNTEDLYNIMMQRLEPFGVTSGRKPKFPPTVYPRGRTLHGMVRDYLEEIAIYCKADWYFLNYKVEMLGHDEVAHDAVQLNSQTGLIGTPQQTIGGGVNVRCLINPNIGVNGLIELNESTVQRVTPSFDDIRMSGERKHVDIHGNQINMDDMSHLPISAATLATDGIYTVRGIIYTGDTRGTPWYMDMMCEARGAADLRSSTAREKGL